MRSNFGMKQLLVGKVSVGNHDTIYKATNSRLVERYLELA